MLMFCSTSKCNVWIRAACVRAISITSFKVSSFSVRLWTGARDFSCCRTGVTSQVSEYLGVDGRRLNTPRRSRLTRGWLPALQPSTTMPSDERAPLAVLMQLYPTPLWKVSDKKFIMWFTEGLRKSMSHLLQNCVHLVICVPINYTIHWLSASNISAVLVAQVSPVRAKWDHRHTLLFCVVYHFILYLGHCVSYHCTNYCLPNLSVISKI